MAHNQFELLKQRRFLPFFLTQALGAFNDNVFRNAMLALGVRYSVGSSIGLPLAIAIGETGLREFLAGTHVMDDLTPAFWPG